MNVETAIRTGTHRLRAAGCKTPRLDARLLVAHAASLPLEAQIRWPDRQLSPAATLRLQVALDRRERGQPLAQITGEKEFWSLSFAVSEDVLIPRPDSEAVVESVLAHLGDRCSQGLRVLDLGTGSGCLLLALLSEIPNATGVGVDASKAALATAVENARRLGLANRARFVLGDWDAAGSEEFDVIVSNPPYIPSGGLAGLAPEIACEPRLALDGGKDGLAAYRRLLPKVARALAPGGTAAIEVGLGQADSVRSLAADSGLNLVGSGHDLGGRERCLVGVRQVVPASEKRLGNCGPNE